ncbi:DUF5666 domain-containing protein [Leifsonia sp. SIMBA_070]|uniref:DUF5666 domain-containing protein n=1 Tax=Leifsonia sp. SIMBA_070 TaxID=3085810 RepID=UPI00397E1DB1
MNIDENPQPDEQPTRPLGSESPETPAGASPASLRRRVLGLSIVAAVLAVIVVAGGTAWGVSAAIAGTRSSASAPMASTASHTHASKSGKHPGRKAHGAVGTITAIDGGSWTIHAASGATVTVKVSSSTAFGTKKSPATQASFAVGDRIGALGFRSGDTVTATRIVHLPVHAHTSRPTPAPTAGA